MTFLHLKLCSYQALARCQLKEVVASKPEKLEASGTSFNYHLSVYYF
jgi:hypothetical protein